MSNKTIRAFSLSLLALMNSSAMAEQVVESQIAAVTIYPSSATVTRTFVVELPAGRQTVLVAGLPSTLDENSLPGSLVAAIKAVQWRVSSLKMRYVASWCCHAQKSYKIS